MSPTRSMAVFPQVIRVGSRFIVRKELRAHLLESAAIPPDANNRVELRATFATVVVAHRLYFRANNARFAKQFEDQRLTRHAKVLQAARTDRKSTRLNSSHIPLSRMP